MKRFQLMLLYLSATVMLFGQAGELSVSMGASRIGNSSLGAPIGTTGLPDVAVTSNFRLAFRFTFNTYKFFGHEFGYAYNHGGLKNYPLQDASGNIRSENVGMAIHQGFYNFLVYATPEGSRIRPFATGGVHFNSYFPPGAGVFSGNGSTKFGVNAGAGVKVKITSMFLFRADFREFMNGKPDFGFLNPSGWFHQTTVDAGIGLMF